MASKKPQTPPPATRGKRLSRGAPPRTPDAPNPAVLARQIKAFEYHVVGYTNARIAESLGIDRQTVATDIFMEGQRRVKERGLRFDVMLDIEKSIAVYEGVIRRSMERITEAQKRAKGLFDEETKTFIIPPEPRASATCFLEEGVIVKARRAIDEIIGLRKQYVQPTVPLPPSGPTVKDIIDALPPDVRLAVLKKANAREAIGMVNVTGT